MSAPVPAGADAPTRTLVVHCPDWPVTAAGVSGDEPAIVVRANRVLAASPAARAAGITTGLRRRESQRRCPHVTVLEHDPGRDARAFEPVAAALDAITPRVEVTRPGTLAFATRGPSRYFGGDDALAERTAWMAGGAAGAGVAVHVGVADGAFAALLAAQRAERREEQAVVVPPLASPAFLAPHPVDALGEVLEAPDLVDVLRRLGLRTLAAFADLAPADVLARFGHPGAVAHRLASGLDPRPLDARRPAPDLAATRELDPPADRVELAAFVAKVLADELHARLAADGLACTHVLVQAETGHGEVLARHWRHEGALTAGALADRVRWQLDGWLSGSSTARPTAGISRLTLVPVEVVAARGRQLGFWGGETLVDERVLRAVARVQGTLGLEAVTVPELRGGRGPGERVARVPVAAVDLTAPRPAARPGAITAPWPGRVPAPAPAAVAPDPEPVRVLDAGGRPVGLTGRAEVTAAPASLARAGHAPVALTAWAGPWPVDERWWDPSAHRRRARFQVTTTEGIAHLLTLESGHWSIEATYD
ncbi:DNA polymerase Y family protein [Aquihabitans sp. G128]|uniref:DNA polymerase Y family protein n=1 Tax=Aquihabitans sp. G128 TaxID=2849779 RepID=UPI001C23011E|nr:DNA polymerase Y family protein [Aquihabitans sp. G128]QXC62840.1 DNA polymerase Y family protein [Aquihabitans sp. G128]